MLSLRAEGAERQGMDMLSVRYISAEHEGMREAERQTKAMLSVRSMVPGVGAS